MILQALKEYYDRKAADPESQMAPPGFEWKEIPFVIVLNPDGAPVNIEPTHEIGGKFYLVPQAVKKTIRACAKINLHFSLEQLSSSSLAVGCNVLS